MLTANITIPVFNEEVRLTRCIPKLHSYLSSQWPYGYEIVIANNASTDRTQEIAEKFAREYSNVRILWLPEKGRGGALKKSWLEGGADVLTYMDVDLSTDLQAFLPLVQSIFSGEFDLAIGSRLLPGAVVQRGWKREIISRLYARLVKILFPAGFSDAQCGFKAISQNAARHLLPLVEDTGWFFDTELLLLAEKMGYRIFEMPVHWVDDPDSRVKIIPTILEDLKGLIRLRRSLRRSPQA